MICEFYFSENVNFLVADGEKFAHPLHHLGKSKDDLPLIAIDSFRHMYLFPKYEDMHLHGKLKQFLEDLFSGKLHREFHYGPDTTPGTTPKFRPFKRTYTKRVEPFGHNKQIPLHPSKSSPPPSQFKHLGPSGNRYTLLRDEF